MIATIVALLILSQHTNTSESTRLPLEVYELTPGSTARFATATGTSASTLSVHKADNNLNYLKRKNLEYSTIKKNKSASRSITVSDDDDAVGAGVTEDEADLDILQMEEHNIRMEQETDRRKSRQMLDVIKQHINNNDIRNGNKNLYKTNKNDGENTSSINKNHHIYNEKDVRVLYQVGESEEDLPICAINAICSKIDLYETPWIERQCRCPENPHHQSTVTMEHRIHQHSNTDNNNENNNNNNNKNNKLYRSYYERDKMLQHRSLLSGVDVGAQKFGTFHLKKIMQKLGAVYENDLQLQPNDYLLTSDNTYAEQNIENNDALPASLENPDDENLNSSGSSSFEDDFPTHVQNHRMQAGLTHMRHGGHHLTHQNTENTVPILNSRLGNCPSGLDINDGHTIADKTRHYKLCQPIHKLPICKHFRDYTWTLKTSLELNVTEQIVHCRCPRNSVTYLTKREAVENGLNGYVYYFACSPVTRLRCRRKQPCKLFTVRKRQEFLDEVNINALCQCPKGHNCPSRHTHSGVIAGESFLEDNIQTYSGYCMAND